MKRVEIINTVGLNYLKTNVENQEFSYPQAFKEAKIPHTPIKSPDGKREYQYLDLRFEKDNVSVLIETKDDFKLSKNKDAEAQLSAYVEYEKSLTNNKIVAILANTNDDKIKVWRGAVSDSNFMENETAIRTMDEYLDFYTPKINNKEKVMQNTYKLNELLHKYGVPENLRSQFVGTCLLALKNGIEYHSPTLSVGQIIIRIKEVLESLLDGDINKAGKLSLLYTNVLEKQKIKSLKIESFRDILETIESDILPFINDKSTAGQDLLNLFFVTFNKYVGKSNKNQAFTPDHITDFMSKITCVNKHSIILDPCCGSGSFLVRAMTHALDDCSNSMEQQNVKKHQIFGIEESEDIFGLATTNMLIHSDGNSNIYRENCFDMEDVICNAKPTVVLMNPPYNATRDVMPSSFTKTWAKKTKEDPSKGLYFVKYIMDILNKKNIHAKIAVLLPLACAIGSNKLISNMKRDILSENALLAVFSLPDDIFYPGASASACCMVFETGVKHETTGETFFGYYKDDGFRKRKKLGRVEMVNSTGKSIWADLEEKWLELYRNKKAVTGLSAVRKVSGNDEWLCEAYMKTDYTRLNVEDFQQTVNDNYAYMIHSSVVNTSEKTTMNMEGWKEFKVGEIFDIERGDRIVHDVDYFDECDEVNCYPVITTTTLNNGVAGFYSDKNCDGNCIISAGEASGMFTTYQELPCWALDTVRVYSFKDKSISMNKYIGLFLSALLTFNMHRFSYGRKAKRGNMSTLDIKLPITKEGNPDWQFMEDYIKSLPYGDRI